jgi:hypothetical protein
MDASDLEEIAGQTDIHGNTRSNRGGRGGPRGLFGFGLSPSIERASAAREKKKTTKPIAAKPPRVESVANPPTVSTCIARPVTGYKGLVETCRQRATEMALSRLELDRLSGLPAGYSAKLLGKDDAVPRKKRMWPASLEAILGTLGLQIIIIEDHAATSRTLSRRVPVDQASQRFDNKCNSKAVPKLLAPPSQPVGPPALTIVRSGRKRGSKYG